MSASLSLIGVSESVIWDWLLCPIFRIEGKMSLILCLFITFIDFEFEIGFDFDLVDLKASLNVEVEMTLEVD